MMKIIIQLQCFILCYTLPLYYNKDLEGGAVPQCFGKEYDLRAE